MQTCCQGAKSRSNFHVSAKTFCADKVPGSTTEPEKHQNAEPASIVKRRRFCRRTSLHFNKVCKNRFGQWPWRLTFRRHRRCAPSEPLSLCAGRGSWSSNIAGVHTQLHVRSSWKNTKPQIAENGPVRYGNRREIWPRSIHGRATQNASKMETVEEKIDGCFGNRGRANPATPCPEGGPMSGGCPGGAPRTGVRGVVRGGPPDVRGGVPPGHPPDTPHKCPGGGPPGQTRPPPGQVSGGGPPGQARPPGSPAG